ncbi:DUF6531 domain-containing protein [Pseudomonas alliivorans]|nr:DUF6531 domain-containing protein [Pseudomonas alliivorans]MEE4724000.1 DUF6531 domain-containing protein [Pseudomonas alliivorans]MEE4760057.1 DUF6531 domain-containing protein [Pseudomonas alliivorans]MEE4765203.1 DUF6531 domain-containing protein [Pseudomonas alliivorans]MEE4775338.1 DUF6531 domain-containing protein [Pseudomonas alliivorans]
MVIFRAGKRRFFKASVTLGSVILLFGDYSIADTYTYRVANTLYESAMSACLDIGAVQWPKYPQAKHSVFPARSGNGSIYYKCYFEITDTITTAPSPPQISTVGPYLVIREGDSCDVGKALNPDAGECISNCASVNKTLNKSTRECGQDEQKGTPPIDSCAGNPINIAAGNKFQVETDYKYADGGGVSFARSYNSLDSVWRHNYSTYIRLGEAEFSLVHSDGRESFFTMVNDTAIFLSGEKGSLSKVGESWLYHAANNEIYTFNVAGRLIEWVNANYQKQILSYAGNQITVKAEGGQWLRFAEDSRHQSLYLNAPGAQFSYIYDGNNNLASISKVRGDHTEQRYFFYENPRDVGLLTGIKDERGVRFATWSYDEKGRAISSQHSGGAGLTRIAYNADGSSTVTNELGKSTVYRYQQIGGVKKVAAIEGEPSANCPASNSSYSYDERGNLLTKTDARGYITAYTYNDRGLETSRTEASGTAQAQTVTTEWDPSRFLPTKVIEPTRITAFTYDDQGRETGRQVTSR